MTKNKRVPAPLWLFLLFNMDDKLYDKYIAWRTAQDKWAYIEGYARGYSDAAQGEDPDTLEELQKLTLL